MELSSRVVRAEGTPSAEVDDEVVLLPPSLESYLALDAIGSRVWALLEHPRRVEELCATLSREFDAGAEEIGRDVLGFLDQLEDQGLVRVLED